MRNHWQPHPSLSSNILPAIWMFGLAFLFFTGWWWPGIMILVGISMLAKGALSGGGWHGFAPHTCDDDDNTPPRPTPTETFQPAPPAPPPAPPQPIAPNTDWLPAICPGCSAPISPRTAVWAGQTTARCPYCDTRFRAE